MCEIAYGQPIFQVPFYERDRFTERKGKPVYSYTNVGSTVNIPRCPPMSYTVKYIKDDDVDDGLYGCRENTLYAKTNYRCKRKDQTAPFNDSFTCGTISYKQSNRDVKNYVKEHIALKEEESLKHITYDETLRPAVNESVRPVFHESAIPIMHKNAGPVLHKQTKFMSTSHKGQKLRSYSIELKLEVVKYAEQHSIHAAERQYKVDRKSIRTWKKCKEQLRELSTSSAKGAQRKRLNGGGRKVLDNEIERMLLEWIYELYKRGESITGSMIISKAVQLKSEKDSATAAELIGAYRQLNFSRGWLDKFISRNHLQFLFSSNNNNSNDNNNKSRYYDSHKMCEANYSPIFQPQILGNFITSGSSYHGVETKTPISMIPSKSCYHECRCKQNEDIRSMNPSLSSFHDERITWTSAKYSSIIDRKHCTTNENRSYPHCDHGMSTQPCSGSQIQRNYGDAQSMATVHSSKGTVVPDVHSMASTSSSHSRNHEFALTTSTVIEYRANSRGDSADTLAAAQISRARSEEPRRNIVVITPKSSSEERGSRNILCDHNDRSDIERPPVYILDD